VPAAVYDDLQNCCLCICFRDFRAMEVRSDLTVAPTSSAGTEISPSGGHIVSVATILVLDVATSISNSWTRCVVIMH
jgi:hypothetical protein